MLHNMFVMLHNGVIQGMILATGRGDFIMRMMHACTQYFLAHFLFHGICCLMVIIKFGKKKKKALFAMNL